MEKIKSFLTCAVAAMSLIDYALISLYICFCDFIYFMIHIYIERILFYVYVRRNLFAKMDCYENVKKNKGTFVL